jgi:hypothetical protein
MISSALALGPSRHNSVGDPTSGHTVVFNNESDNDVDDSLTCRTDLTTVRASNLHRVKVRRFRSYQDCVNIANASFILVLRRPSLSFVRFIVLKNNEPRTGNCRLVKPSVVLFYYL